jgi:hypothetical protein
MRSKMLTDDLSSHSPSLASISRSSLLKMAVADQAKFKCNTKLWQPFAVLAVPASRISVEVRLKAKSSYCYLHGNSV